MTMSTRALFLLCWKNQDLALSGLVGLDGASQQLAFLSWLMGSLKVSLKVLGG